MDLLKHYEAMFNAIDAAVSVPVIAISPYEDLNNEAPDLPFIAYRNETERGIYGTPNAGSNKVLRSTWIISVYFRDADDAINEANLVVNALVDAELTPGDGYATTALTLIGFMPLFEAEGPNFAVHVRVMWERSI